MKLPRDYALDSGVAMVFDTLCDRGHDREQLIEMLDTFDGDLWCTIFGPAVDSAAEAIGLPAYPEDDAA